MPVLSALYTAQGDQKPYERRDLASSGAVRLALLDRPRLASSIVRGQ